MPSSALAALDAFNPYQYSTVTPANAAFSNQPGMLRQLVVARAIAISATQPTLCTSPDAAPDHLRPMKITIGSYPTFPNSSYAGLTG